MVGKRVRTKKLSCTKIIAEVGMQPIFSLFYFYLCSLCVYKDIELLLRTEFVKKQHSELYKGIVLNYLFEMR